MIQPKFLETNFWNFVEGARAIGAKAESPPLGLLTVAAMLPKQWEIELADLNVRPVTDEQWQKADLILTGGMLPQQPGILEIVRKAKADGKYVVVGGPDPTSQPNLYQEADAVVAGEGEGSLPLWLESWASGKPNGIFECKDSPDVSKTPIPRFDLVSFDDYLHTGLQSSRGCPYNCEFCDIIELFGRRPRVKNVDQWISELQALYNAGYRGWVDIADDNFIGNRLKMKPLLIAMAEWSKKHKYPFVFSTEASVNLADDEELLSLMQAAQFRYVFLGIETPNNDVLIQTQKRINTVKPLIERIRRIYSYGISITAGFIIGFDSEPENTDKELIPFIQESGIMLAMVGLLSALPNTQLTRRLAKERRLISSNHEWITQQIETYELVSHESHDQTLGGLNFVSMRDRVAIYRELQNVVRAIYSPKAFMDRVLDTTTRLNIQSKHVPGLWEFRRMLRGFFNVAGTLLWNKDTRWLYLRNAWKSLWMGPAKFEFAHTSMGAFLHFHHQTKRMLEELDVAIDFATRRATYPRSVKSDEFQALSQETEQPVS